jgi:putative DNA methylase
VKIGYQTLIEQWFPAPAVGVECMRERATFTALPPLFALHVWWARRPLIGSRAAVVVSLLPAWPSEEDAVDDPRAATVRDGLRAEFANEDAYHSWVMRALGILGDPVAGRKAIDAANEAGLRLEGNGYGYARAFTVSPDAATLKRLKRLASLRADTAERPVVLDPFAGGGSIPFEAARYGCDTIANELNPVATAILQGTVALPADLGPGFSTEINRWGGIWADRVRKRLDPFFPTQNGESIVAYIWAHTVPCPTTGHPTPLAPDFWLGRGKRDAATRLDVNRETGECSLSIVEGSKAADYGNRSTYKRGVGESIWTGETFSGDYIRSQAAAGHVGQMLLGLAVSLPGVRGRRFRVPCEADLAAIESAGLELIRRRGAWDVDDLIPNDSIVPGWKTDEPRRMGMRQWADMFSPRQLLANVTALEELREVVAEVRSEDGDAKAQALGLYLALMLDKACDYNGILSSWHASRVTVRNTFDRHDFAFKWTFAEFDAAHALIPWVTKQSVRVFDGMSKLTYQPETMISAEQRASARIIRGSATTLPLETASVDAVITDPPYYDNVMYAECSDYFYVWLRRALRDTWPQFCDLVLTDKSEEAVANPSLFKDVATHSGRGARITGSRTAVELADARYEELLTGSFREAHRVLKDDGVMTVMFTHKRVDAWDTLGAALLEAGFAVSSSWPVHTESEHSLHQAKKNAAQSTIFLTCRKRQGSEPAYWADIRGEVELAAEEAVHRFSAQGLAGVDLTLATYGPVLSVLSRRWPVFTGELDGDGQPQVLRPDAALDLARERVAVLKKRGLLGGRDVDFDRVTDWYLLAWSDFQAAEFPSGEALKLSLATHLDLDDLARIHRVVKTSAGTTTLLAPAQRRTAGGLDPDAGNWPTLLDALHSLMLVYDEDGLAAARAWLTRTKFGDDAPFRDLFEASLHAIPRVRTKDGFARPEARILDSLRAALFEDIALPIEEVDIPANMQLGFEIEGQLFSLPGELGADDVAEVDAPGEDDGAE